MKLKINLYLVYWILYTILFVNITLERGSRLVRKGKKNRRRKILKLYERIIHFNTTMFNVKIAIKTTINILTGI